MGGRERGGRKPTDTSASESRSGTQEYRLEKDIRERDKGFYRGERTGRHRIHELRRQVSGSRECYWWKDKNHSRTWWQGRTRTTDLLNT